MLLDLGGCLAGRPEWAWPPWATRPLARVPYALVTVSFATAACPRSVTFTCDECASAWVLVSGSLALNREKALGASK
jgi:hypothetical protein